ncbi:hypothetical protein [Plantactinospora sp. B5E13]|uniref:hypothetical protein n=1 Tax=Plantactinospora sp. B5E13 TaxID=3153758 RepID=UPI00325F4F8A
MTVTPVTRTARIGLAAVLIGGLLGPAGGCARGCTETALQVWPVQVQRLDAPLTVNARLSAAGEPLSGVAVKLAVTVVGPDHAAGEALFHATTDADGLATVTRPEGVAGLSAAGQRVTGYAAHFQPLNKVDGTAYCWSGASAPISCPGDGGPGQCPAGRDGAAPDG